MLNFVRDKGIGGVEFSLTRHLLDSIIVQMQGILASRGIPDPLQIDPR